MPEIHAQRISFEDGIGPRVNTWTLFFDRPVLGCWVGLSGWQLRYRDGDHHVQKASVQVMAAQRTTEFGPGVVVEAMLELHDDSDDDAFGGWVDCVLFVELGRSLPVGVLTNAEEVAV